MHVWLITVGEPLPIDNSRNRLLRTGILANLLVEKGHTVTWWTSTFIHTQKVQRFHRDTCIHLNEIFDIILLHSICYEKNISVRRIVNQQHIAKKFSRKAPLQKKPDVILCSFPTIELSLAATQYGLRNNIPVVLDVRDLWPDIFIDLAPKNLRWLARGVLHHFFKHTETAFRQCTAITGVSEGYLKWGLSYANREKSENDAVFPLGYQKPSIPEEECKKAKNSLLNQGIDPSKLICWFVGIFGKTYDLGPVIIAARELDLQGFDRIQFVFSGQGDKFSEWFDKAKGLKNVVFTGWVNTEQLAYLMRVADIGLMTYAKGAPQGLPNKIFEYLCAGIPVLSSLKGETESLLKDNNCGLTYEAGNSISFINALSILTSNKTIRKEMGSNGLRLFENNYSADIIYSQMIRFLERQCLKI